MTDDSKLARSIKSFVRRSGRLTTAQKNALQQYWPLYGLKFESAAIDSNSFGKEFDALKLEIGIGNGDALIAMAMQDPTSLYLGIEVHEPGVGRCLNNIHQGGLKNVRLMSHDAIEVMQTMLKPQSLERVLLFFPDPWHKKRHHKRRIVNQQFRDLCFSLLRPGGVVHLATDWQPYAEHMALEMLGDARYLNQGDEQGYAPRPAYRPVTRFEQRGLKLGHGVWDLVFEKAAVR